MALNKGQQEAVNTTEGPVLILAGAGTGKTTTLVHRVAHLLETGVSGDAILLMTFTNKAANEMKERIKKMIGGGEAERVCACTIHSFCVRMLRMYGAKAGVVREDFTVVPSSDVPDLINMAKAENGKKFELKGFPPSKAVAGMFSMMVNMRMNLDAMLGTKRYEKYAEFRDGLMLLHNAVTVYKQKNGILDYDDLMLAMLRMLVENEDVCRRISGTYRYVMVDEYQDTNSLQDEIIMKIREDNKNLAVVGDDMQSLYGFRGADVQNIITFPERHPGCSVIYLTENYRSRQGILDAANSVQEHATEGYKKHLSGVRPGTADVKIVHTKDQRGEASAVMNVIRWTKRAGRKAEDVCILYRNSASTANLEVLLGREGVPYVKYGGAKFLEQEHVKDVLAYLRILTNPKDEVAWFRVLMVHSGVGTVNSRCIAAGCKDEGYGHLLDARYTRRAFAPELPILYKELEKLRENTDTLPNRILEVIRFYTDTKERNLKNMKTNSEASRTERLELNNSHRETLKVLADLAEGYQSAVDFLDDLTLDATGANEPAETDGKVVLSTIHSAKGLEYGTVVILDCIDGMFPSTESGDEGTREDNEELRCLYVAITRAKDCLYIMQPDVALKYGRKIRNDGAHMLEGAGIEERTY